MAQHNDWRGAALADWPRLCQRCVTGNIDRFAVQLLLLLLLVLGKFAHKGAFVPRNPLGFRAAVRCDGGAAMVMGGAEKRRASGERWRLIGSLQPDMVAARLAVLREKGSICVKMAPAFFTARWGWCWLINLF